MQTASQWAVAWLSLFAGSTAAHFNMVLPQSASAKKGEALTFTYQWGHPFEHQLFDAPQPVSLIVLAPDGKKTDLTERLRKSTRQSGEKEATVYELPFTPQQRGDYVFVLNTPPIRMDEDEEFLQDTVKVVLHVQAQKDWDAEPADDFQLTPLTRPYGLQPGMVFQALLRSEGTARSPLARSLVEVERYSATPPTTLPPDEHITRTVKTDPAGVATTTLTEPGWWCLTASRPRGTRMHEGKRYVVRQRCSLWVYVDEPVRGK